MAPSSRFASSLKPNVAYLDLNFDAGVKKQTTLPSLLAYAGIPYQVFGERVGALALTSSWSRLAIARSGPGICAIFASKAFSSFSPRAAAFRSWTVSFSAARSSAVSPLPFAAVVLADVFAPFFVAFRSAISGRHLLRGLRRLEDPDGVAEGVAEAHIDAVEVVGGLLGEVGDSARHEGRVETSDVVRLENNGAHRALGDQLAELRGGGFVVQRRARLLQEDLDVGVPGDAHRQPAEGALLDVVAFLQPELIDVEVEGLVLVEDHDGCDVQLDHRLCSPFARFDGTTVTLASRCRAGFSKTARSHRDPRRHARPRRRHLDAVGSRQRPVPQAIVRWRLADDLPEHAAEGPEAGEADVEADVGDAPVGLAQQEHRALHPPPLKVAVRRLSECGAEAADEVRLGDMGHRGHGADVERLGVGAVHRVAGTQQAPVQVLDLSAHGQTLRHQGPMRIKTRHHGESDNGRTTEKT